MFSGYIRRLEDGPRSDLLKLFSKILKYGTMLCFIFLMVVFVSNHATAKDTSALRSGEGGASKINVDAGVDVKYRGHVPLKTFVCEDTPRSSFVRRVCYDAAQMYMLIKLRGTYYHYCNIDAQTVASLLAAPSIGRFYNQKIKVSATEGKFDCRLHPVPKY